MRREEVSAHVLAVLDGEAMRRLELVQHGSVFGRHGRGDRVDARLQADRVERKSDLAADRRNAALVGREVSSR